MSSAYYFAHFTGIDRNVPAGQNAPRVRSPIQYAWLADALGAAVLRWPPIAILSASLLPRCHQRHHIVVRSAPLCSVIQPGLHMTHGTQ